MKIDTYVPIGAVFPGIDSTRQSLEAIVRRISRTDALFWCARLNLTLSELSGRGLDAQQYCIDQFFEKDEINRINEYCMKRGGAKRVSVFFRAQLLELFRVILLCAEDHAEDGNTFEDASIRRLFAQAALIAGDLWANEAWTSLSLEDDASSIPEEEILRMVRRASPGNPQVPEFGYGIGRGWTLFGDLFPTIRPGFDDEFQAATNLSLSEYYCCASMIAIHCMKSAEGNPIFDPKEWSIRENERDLIVRYVNLLSQSADEILAQCDVSERLAFERLVRAKPILQTTDGRHIIIDLLLFDDTMSVGPLFHVLDSIQDKHSGDQLIADFGQPFEKYMGNILETMFPTSPRLAKRLSVDYTLKISQGHEIQMDALLNDVVEVVVFEAKTAFIPEGATLDSKLFLDKLQERYCNPKKAIGQLANSTSWITNSVKRGHDDFKRVKYLYPVMIVHDSLIVGPRYGSFFTTEYKRFLKPERIREDRFMVKNGVAVAPPVLLGINDLESLQRSVERFGLLELIKDYHKACPDRSDTLHDFIAATPKYSKEMIHSGYVAEKAMRVLDECRARFFQ